MSWKMGTSTRGRRPLTAWIGILVVAAAIASLDVGRVSGQDTKKGQPDAGKAPDGTESSPAALTMYADAANFQNNGAYELAADEWSRFLTQFGDDPLASKAQHYLGVCRLKLKKYAEAAEAFQVVVKKYPKFEQIEDTYLNLGWCQYSLAEAGDKKQYEQAAATFAKLAADFPKGKYVDQALFFQGESYYALEKRKEAAMAYGKLVMGHAESKLRCDALYAMGVTLEEMEQWAQAARAYDMFLKDCGKHELLNEVRMRKAETMLQQGDAAGAEARFGEVAAVEGFEAADHALFRQAFCAAKQDNMAAAGALYAALTERFPKSSYVKESLLSAGRCFYRAGRFDEAAKWFDKVMAAGKESAIEAAHWRNRIYLREGKAAQALELSTKMLPEAGDSPFTANLKLDHADALYAQKDRRPEALREYLALYEQHPTHEAAAQALYDAAFAALELKQFDQAVQLSDQFLKTFPKDTLVPDTRYIVAECRIQQKQYPQAEQAYRELVTQNTKHADVELWQVRLGFVLFLQKKYAATVEFLQPLVAALGSDESKAEAYYLIGASQFQENQFAPAAESLRASLLANAKWRQADETLLYLARAQQKLNKLPDARNTMATLNKSFPESRILDQAHYYLGEFEYAAHQFPAAISAYDQVLQHSPTSVFVPFAWYGKGWALLKSGQYDPAAQCFTELIEHKPPHQLRTDALLARGMCWRQSGKFAEAIADIDQFLAAKPKAGQRADALYERGLAQAGIKKYQEAIETLTTLLKEQPQYAAADKVYYEMGWAYLSLNDVPHATEAFANLAGNHADSPLAAEANFHVGEERYSRKDYAQAIAAYQQSVAKSKNAELSEKARYKLAWSHYQLRQYREALGQFESQLGAAPDGPLAADAWFMKGECLFKLEDFEKALPAFLEAQRRPASSPQLAVMMHLHGGQAAAQLQQWEQSIKLLDPVFEKFPNTPYLAEAYFERGRARQKLDQLDEAAADFREASAKSRGVVGARAQFMLGEIGFQQKNYAQAIKDFQRVMFRAVPPGDDAEVGNWQAKAGYEAGRCAEVQIESSKTTTDRTRHITDAKRFYQYVVDKFPKNDMAADAKKRLDALAKLK